MFEEDMPNSKLLAGAAGACLILLAAAAQAHDYTIGTLEIVHPWSRATPPCAKTGAGYMTLINRGSEDDRLISAETEAASEAEVHRSGMTDGIMRMRPQPNGIALPAGVTVEPAPGGYHLMLMGLTRPLGDDDRIPLPLPSAKQSEEPRAAKEGVKACYYRR